MSDSEEITARLRRHLDRSGWAAKLLPIACVEELRKEIAGGRDCGLFDEEFFHEYLDWFSFSLPEDLPRAQSVIVIALPAPQFRIEFQRHGRSIRLVLPPTYLGYRRTIAEMRDHLNDFLRADGHRVVDARLPFKLLAARCGLAEYGRNNILYRSGMGSFMQLGAYFTDLPCEGDPWRPPAMLERCKSCDACVRACPTRAIGRDRFVLRAERCITFHNERAAPLPGWIGHGWHDCLVGCMICQRTCPENRSVIRKFTNSVSFSEEETAQLLSADEAHPPAPELLAKWEDLGLTEDRERLMRNLSTILDHSELGNHRQRRGK